MLALVPLWCLGCCAGGRNYAGVLGLKNYAIKNSSSHQLDLEVKDPETSASFRSDVEETRYFTGLLNHYTSSEGLLRKINLNNSGWNSAGEDFANKPSECSGQGSMEIEKISDHMKKHEKPLGETEFGYYLAGLIEGGGYFADQ